MKNLISLADFDVGTQPGLRDRLAEIYQEFRTVQASSQHALTLPGVTELRPHCPNCRAAISNSQTLFVKNEIPHARCEQCHLVYTHVTLSTDQDAAQYDDSDFMRAYAKLKRHPLYAQLEIAKAGYLLQRAGQLLKINEGNLLDIGASTGAVMAAASDEGYVSYGIEPDGAMAEILAAQYPSRFVTGYFPQDLPAEWPSFHLITLFDVLEHMLDPIAFLQAIRPVISKGGLLLIQVPNLNSLLVQLQGIENSNFCIGHWQHFTEETLICLMRNAGYRCVESGTCISEIDRILGYPNEVINNSVQKLLGRIVPIAKAEDLYGHGLGYKLYGMFEPISA